MGNLERLKRIYRILISLSIISGIVHIFYAIRFFSDIAFFIELGFQNDVDLAFAYMFSLTIFVLLILIVLIIRAINRDVTDEINYLYGEIRNLEKSLHHDEKPHSTLGNR